jgi:hypothetical protein
LDESESLEDTIIEDIIIPEEPKMPVVIKRQPRVPTPNKKGKPVVVKKFMKTMKK